jgi:hypothetical protein
MFLATPVLAQKPTPKTDAINLNSSRSNVTVTAVDAKTRTFAAISKEGKKFTFTAPKSGSLPAVGSTYAVKISQDPKSGQFFACCIKGSKSNGSE